MEPDVVAQSLCEVWERLVSWMPGGRFDRLAAGSLFSTDSPAPDLQGPLVPVAGADLTTVESARRLVRTQHRPLAIELVIGATSLDDHLESEGFERIASRALMCTDAAIGSSHPNARRATDADLDTAVQLQAAAFEMSLDSAASLYGPGWIDTASSHILVEVQDRPVAMATAHPTEHSIGIFGVCTHPRHRLSGHATVAVRAAVASVARHDDPRPVWVHCGPGLIGVYETMGFATTGTCDVFVETHV